MKAGLLRNPVLALCAGLTVLVLLCAMLWPRSLKTEPLASGSVMQSASRTAPAHFAGYTAPGDSTSTTLTIETPDTADGLSLEPLERKTQLAQAPDSADPTTVEAETEDTETPSLSEAENENGSWVSDGLPDEVAPSQGTVKRLQTYIDAVSESEAGPASQIYVDSTSWDPSEFEMLAASPAEAATAPDLPPGAIITPAKPLALEELLAANREHTHIGYVQSGPLAGRPFDLQGGSGRAQSGLAPGQITIESPNFLDYDEEHHQIYGQGRPVVRYGDFKLEAERVMIDTRLREIQAWGNVILTGATEYIEAESLWFDTIHYEGVAYGARGRSDTFYFLADPFCDDGRTTIRQLSEKETHFKDSSFTACNFPVPHYRFHAEEFTIFANDRVFAKNVWLYVWEKPILWLPWFTRSLVEKNPWGFTAGSDGELGFYARLWYDYYSECYTPSDVDENIMVRNTYTHARLRSDFFSKRGWGKGLHYSYYLDGGRQRGKLDIYHINDRDRDVVGEDDGANRYYVDLYHRTRINDELQWLVNMDYSSDPDIFFDIFDRVRSSSEKRRGRLPERVMQTGFEWSAEDFFAGIQFEIKDRIGRDRVSNFAEPKDNDQDYDRVFNAEDYFTMASGGIGPDGRFYPNAGRYLDPTSVDSSDLDLGLASSRYGRVTQRMPHLRASSNRMRLWCLPLWYHVDLNVFNNLDKGLNVVGTGDDSFVHGFDLYQSISHLAKFCDRYTLLTKFGLGMGVAQRADDSYNLDFPDGTTFPFVYDGQVLNDHILGLTFVDEETFLVGDKEMSLRDVQPAFVYGDIDSRFNARISDSMTAWIRYRFREGTDNSLGQFYEAIGSRKTQDDLYAFRNPEHWLEAGATYQLQNPRLTLSGSVGRNLQGQSDITPDELLQYANVNVGWQNLCNTLFVNGGISLQERQLRDPSDPNQYQQNSLTYYVSGSHVPVHQRYWTKFSAFFIQNGNSDPLDISVPDRDFEDRTETVFDWTLGRKIGTKYLVEYRTRMRSRQDGWTDSTFRIERDFHDVIAGISLGIKGERLSDDEEDATEDNMQLRFNVRFKQSAEKGVTPDKRTSKLFSARKASAFETTTY